MFEIVDSTQGGTLTLAGRGEIDASTAPELRRHLEEAVGSTAEDVVVDLTEVGFLDSAGVGVLVEGHRRLEEAGKPLVIRVATPATIRVLSLTGMDQYFTLERVDPA